MKRTRLADAKYMHFKKGVGRVKSRYIKVGSPNSPHEINARPLAVSVRNFEGLD